MIRECAGRATVTLKGGSALPAPARPVVERPPALHASPKDRHHRRRGDQSRCGDARNRKFVDSPLEGAGFERSVPLDTTKVSGPAHVASHGKYKWQEASELQARVGYGSTDVAIVAAAR